MYTIYFQSNTFQVILVTNGELSFVFFSYGDIEWGFNANIGFNSRNRSFTVPGALTINTIDVETTSNVGVAGLHVYRVDQENITEPLYKVCRGQCSYKVRPICHWTGTKEIIEVCLILFNAQQVSNEYH